MHNKFPYAKIVPIEFQLLNGYEFNCNLPTWTSLSLQL